MSAAKILLYLLAIRYHGHNLFDDNKMVQKRRRPHPLAHILSYYHIVEFRIDIASEGPVTVVHLTGRLSKNKVTQLRKVCDQIKGAVVLELSNLRSADAKGSESIRTLSEKGAKIRGASPFIQLLIDNTYRE